MRRGFEMNITLKPSEQRIKVNFTALYKGDGNEYEKGFNEGYESGYNKGRDSKVIEPLTITENGTYTASEIDGYNPVTVEVKGDKASVIKELIELKGGYARELFAGYGSWRYPNIVTDEFVAECLRFDTTENAITIERMFFACEQVTTIPPFSTKSLIYNISPISGVFAGCTKLKELPMLDLSKMGSFYNFCSNCVNITTMPLYDLKNVDTVNACCNGCTALKVIPAWDLRTCVTYNGFVQYCSALEEIWIRNIKANLQVGVGTSWGHLIKQECAIHLLYELRDTGSAKTITFSKKTGELLANVYVKSIPITDEMRAEDDLVDEKLPFAVCESTDEGATLITEYVLQKNWQVALA
jgi:hypothetical protein